MRGGAAPSVPRAVKGAARSFTTNTSMATVVAASQAGTRGSVFTRITGMASCMVKGTVRSLIAFWYPTILPVHDSMWCNLKCTLKK